ncbi:ABC transporter permease [Acidaminobacterium chupaoyuni]
MTKYVLKRLLYMIPVLFGVTFLVYLMMRWAPGDPNKAVLRGVTDPKQIEAIREAHGLNDPMIVQYGRTMKALLIDDAGKVRTKILYRLPFTAKLAAAATVIAIGMALPIGVVAAVKQNSIFDGFSMMLSFVGVSMPSFWLALLVVLFFSLRLGWFPSSGSDSWKCIVLPAFTLGFCDMAYISRITRSSMLETIRQDYIRTARAKGMSYPAVIRRHALKNALIPIITVAGLRLCELFSGAILIENIFAWPGIGRLLIDALQSRQIPMILGCVITFAICFSFINLIVDLLYAFFDPRVKSEFAN